MSRPYADESTEDLLRIKNDNKRIPSQIALINAELRQRELEENIKKLTKPHWSLVPIFWITLASLLIALLAYFRPFQPVSPNNQYTFSSSPVTTTMQNSQSTSTQKKPISQHIPVQKKP